MKLSNCKLLRKQQIRLLEYFVLEVTARSAADMMEIQANTAILFYRKLREVIALLSGAASPRNIRWRS